MCVIAYKPTNIAFPSETILKNCYENNPDGAGFMYAWKGNVHIQKGYETWTAFKNALDKARAKTGDNVPYVMHFRIATQGFERTMTHPFPLSSKMGNLKKLHTDCNIGVAHNGVLDLTSDGSKAYSDTMKFITDYLSLIIRGYDFYEDDRTKTLIERLIDGSRLAILDKHGHCELMGKGWIEDGGLHYSNNSYSYKKFSYNPSKWDNWSAWDDYEWTGNAYKHKETKGSSISKSVYSPFYDDYDAYYNYKTDQYNFSEQVCPFAIDNDDSYCCMCANKHKCSYIQGIIDEDELNINIS